MATLELLYTSSYIIFHVSPCDLVIGRERNRSYVSHAYDKRRNCSYAHPRLWQDGIF